MNWTENQLSAIETRNQKIIVQAAAGSGKTAVLSTRILHYLKNGGNIDKLLVVTFTKLAASEMKTRIKKNITNELKNNSDLNLKEQLNLIENASITTMDAFYNKLLKENSLYLDINPNFNLIDEIEYKLIKQSVLDEIIENNISNYEILFNNFYNIKKGDVGSNIIIDIYNHIINIPFYDKWLKNTAELYNQDIKETIWFECLFNELFIIFNSYKEKYDLIKLKVENDELLFKKLFEIINQELKQLENIIEVIENKDYTKLKDILSDIEFVRFPIIKDCENQGLVNEYRNLRSYLKEEIKLYYDTFFKYTLQQQQEFLSKQYQFLKIIDDLMEKYIKDLELKRKELNILSFEDIPHLIVKLLIKDYDFITGTFIKTEYAMEISNSFDEILIDEFQDTNLLQNLIFKALSKDENNLFIVGDVKQSIYSFRSARPDIMVHMKKEAQFNKKDLVIGLDQNFRSRKEVLDFTNSIFSRIMTEKFGNIDYNSEKLNLGSKFPINLDSVPEIYFINENNDDNDYKKIEKEALFVGQKIKDLIENEYSIAENGITRPIKSNDIAILLRSVSTYSTIFKNILNEMGLEVKIDNSSNYLENYEVKLLLSYLKILCDKRDEISLISVLRSPLYKINPQLLYEIRQENVNLHDYIFSEKTNTFNEFINDYNSIFSKKDILKLDELINFIYQKTNYIFIFNQFSDGNQRQKNILEMLNHARKYTQSHNNKLAEFINYINVLIENKYSLTGTNETSDKDSILLTSIHKSKGLEFPVVFLPNFNGNFNLKDLSDQILIDDNYYIGMLIRNNETYNIESPLNIELIKMQMRKKAIEEEMRILYVALTRAKEKLIISQVTKDVYVKSEKILALIDKNISYNYLLKSRSYLDFCLPFLVKHHNSEINKYIEIDQELYNEPIKFDVKFIEEDIIHSKTKLKSKTESIEMEKIINNLNAYLEEQTVDIKNRLTVSDYLNLNIKLKPTFIDNIGEDIGSLYHKILENISFKEYDYNSFSKEINVLKDNLLITNDEYDKINLKKLYSFFETSIYKNIILKGKVYREKEIYFTKLINDNKILIEGVIDLYVILNNTCYLIDYKSDVILDEEKLIRYEKQINLYEEALKEKGYNNIIKMIYSISEQKFINLGGEKND